MNNVHALSGQHVGCGVKVVWPITFFLNSKHLFVWHLCQLSASQPHGMSAHGVDWNILIITKCNIHFYNNEHNIHTYTYIYIYIYIYI